jgi:hypothetical protein
MSGVSERGVVVYWRPRDGSPRNWREQCSQWVWRNRREIMLTYLTIASLVSVAWQFAMK